MQVQFIRPEWLLALLALPLTLLLERGSYSALGRFQRRLATAIRLVLLAVLALALAGFQSRNPNPPLQVVYLLDRSLSITPSDFDAARTYVREAVESIPDKRAEKVQSAALIFGRSASFEHGFSKNLDLSEVQSIVADEYTDIARALELAAATFDAGAQKRIVLLSDGRENIGSAEDTARRLRQRGITVDTVPVGTDRADEVLARKVIIPSKADQKETFVVKCVVESAVEKDAILKLYRNNTYIGERNVHLEPGRNVFSFDMTEPSKGFYTYSFEIDAPGDPQSANNRARNFTFVEGQPRMLYLSGDPSERPDLATMLRPKQIDLEFHQTAFMPHDMRDLLTYDAVFFSDVSAETLTPGQQELIRGYVRALGKGFVMIGGDQSFGVGGWYQSTVEEVLPVTMDFKRQQHFPATALCIVIDRSGSMGEMSGGYTKLDLAKKAAEQSGSLLTARDYIGVIQFDSAGSWVTDRLQKASSKSRLRNQIGSISMGGGTNIYAGLRPAVDELQKSRAQVKHIILLTDGMSAPGDWEGILRDCERGGITLTCVATGPDSDERFLKDLAKRGDGRYYPLLDARNLPRIFTKETFLAATKSVIEDPFTPAPGESHPIIQGFPFAASQPLLGYNATTKKPLATVSMTAPSGDPLLVHWNYGLGKSMAWTSDAKNRWAAAWMGWAPAQGLWTQAVRWLVGEQESKQLVANISREGTRTTISVDSFAPDGSLDPQGEVTAHIIMPNLEVREIPLRQVAPGRFEVTAEFPDVGDYLVNLIKEGAAEAVGVHTGFSVSYSPEYAAGPLNTFLLTRVAETTAGAFNPEPALVYRPVEIGAEGINWRDWTKPFLTLLILLFPLDIAMRRIMLPEEGFRVWWDAAMAGLLAVVRPAEAAARVRMGQGAAVAARWQRVAEQRVITDEQMNRRRRAGTPTIGATGTEEPPRPSAGSGDLQNRVERILSGGGGERRQRAPEDDTYEKLLEAKRRARRD